jgi:RecA-family ATPase
MRKQPTPLPVSAHDTEIATQSEVGIVPAWTFVNPTTLHHAAVPEREWIVDGWLAPGHVTIDYGDGGVGKTLLSQQLMTSGAARRPWLGLAVAPCRAIGLFCEDDAAELHRRQHLINTAYGITFNDLADMRWVSGVGEDNTLASLTATGNIIKTPAFDAFLNEAASFQARLIVIDTAADTYGGDENNRRQVRQYVGMILGKLAKDLKSAVLLNAHPSRAGMGRDGDLDGGSTAWSNTARARWSLARAKGEGDDRPDADERILTRRKANYASIGDTIRLRWSNGVLVPVERPSGLAALAQQTGADAAFMAMLAKATAEGRHLSDRRNAGNFAPREFGKRPDRGGFTARDLEAAMERLFAADKIRMADYGRPNGRGQPRRIVAVEGDTSA